MRHTLFALLLATPGILNAQPPEEQKAREALLKEQQRITKLEAETREKIMTYRTQIRALSASPPGYQSFEKLLVDAQQKELGETVQVLADMSRAISQMQFEMSRVKDQAKLSKDKKPKPGKDDLDADLRTNEEYQDLTKKADELTKELKLIPAGKDNDEKRAAHEINLEAIRKRLEAVRARIIAARDDDENFTKRQIEQINAEIENINGKQKYFAQRAKELNDKIGKYHEQIVSTAELGQGMADQERILKMLKERSIEITFELNGIRLPKK